MDRGFKRQVFGENFINARAAGLAVEAEMSGQMALRVHVDQEHSLVPLSQSGPKVHCGGCFSNASFLIDDRDALHCTHPFNGAKSP